MAVETQAQRVIQTILQFKPGMVFTNQDVYDLLRVEPAVISQAKTAMIRMGTVHRINHRLAVRCGEKNAAGLPWVPMSEDTEKLCVRFGVGTSRRSISSKPVLVKKEPKVQPESENMEELHVSAEEAVCAYEHTPKAKIGDMVEVTRQHSNAAIVRKGDVGTIAAVYDKSVIVRFCYLDRVRAFNYGHVTIGNTLKIIPKRDTLNRRNVGGRMTEESPKVEPKAQEAVKVVPTKPVYTKVIAVISVCVNVLLIALLVYLHIF